MAARQSVSRSSARMRTDERGEPVRETPVRKIDSDGADAAGELDRIIHERIRLAIVSALAANESLSFTELRDILKTTDGNLSVHARKLEESQYVSCRKFFEGRTPRTEYRLTASGRKALERYLRHMESVIKAARA